MPMWPPLSRRSAASGSRGYAGRMKDREPREHGIIFGRGDDVADDVEEPPMAYQPFAIQIPVYGPGPVAFGAPPKEEVELTGDIPWELQDEPTAKPATRPATH